MTNSAIRFALAVSSFGECLRRSSPAQATLKAKTDFIMKSVFL
jgi:hypothetical protein